LLIDYFNEECDGFGFRIKSAKRIFFSISTAGGQLEYGIYSYQMSILDDSLENGDILSVGIGNEEEVIQVVQVLINKENKKNMC
jgi:hypothetical protein